MTITRNGTIVGSLMNTLYIIVLGILVSGLFLRAGAESPRMVFFVCSMGFLFFTLSVADKLLKRHALKRRSLEIAELAAQYGMPYESEKFALGFTTFSFMSLSDMRGARDRTYSNILLDKEWQYCDFSYSTYKHTKYGDYKSATHHYSVMTVELPRSLPNVLFDSIKHRRRQFRFHFAKSQLHRLEGDFDKYFATYFPKGYTIDSMSFISPDVMWALREAGDYDVEIVGNRIFLYGQLNDPKAQLDDMHTKLMSIKKQLLDNILTYRDERLPMDIGRQRVTPMAMELKRSSFWKTVSAVLFVLYLLMYLLPHLLSIFD